MPKNPRTKIWLSEISALWSCYARGNTLSYGVGRMRSRAEDLKNKFKRALDIEGYRFIHVQVPCPTGWRYPADKTIEVGRLSVQTGLWKLIEIENGIFKMTYKPKELRPVSDYTKSQRRFRYLTTENLENLQNMTYIEYQEYMEKDGKQLFKI